MVSILMVLLFFQSQVLSCRGDVVDENAYYPTLNARQLLSDVQIAIHTKNDSALPELFTQEIAAIIMDQLQETRSSKIPVYDVFEVENVDVNHFPIVEFLAKIGDVVSNFTAVYSEDTRKYLLTQKNLLEIFANKEKLEELIKVEAKEDAFQLLMDVRNAIWMKKRNVFLYDLLTPTARFITCDRKSKNSKTVFVEIEQIPTPYIPVISIKNIEVTSVHVAGNRMIFHAKIDGKDVQYMATYSIFCGRWHLGQEKCVDHYPALINQTALGPEIAYQTVGLFSFALKLVSPRRYNEIVARELTVIKCAEYGEGFYRFFDNTFFDHYFDFKQYYQIDYTNPSFNVSDIVFNVTSGSLKFVVELNNLVTNEIQVERINGDYRMVSIKHLKCQNYTIPDKREKEKQRAKFRYMALAEDFVGRYAHVSRRGTIDERLQLFANPYTLSNGSQITHDQMESFIFPGDVQHLYVIDLDIQLYGLVSFRAKAVFANEGLEFRVRYLPFVEKVIVSEKRFVLY